MTTTDADRTGSAGLGDGSGFPVTTTESERLFARANAVTPGGVQGEGRGSTPFPLFMTRAQGSRIWDVDGNEYIDFHSSFGDVLLGHNDPRIQLVVNTTIDENRVPFSTKK